MKIYCDSEYDERFTNRYEEWIPIDTTYGQYEYERYFRPNNMPWFRNLKTEEIIHPHGGKSVHVTGERLNTGNYTEIDDTLEALIKFIRENVHEPYGIYWKYDKLWFDYMGE